VIVNDWLCNNWRSDVIYNTRWQIFHFYAWPNKADRHDITETLLKAAFHTTTITLTLTYIHNTQKMRKGDLFFFTFVETPICLRFSENIHKESSTCREHYTLKIRYSLWFVSGRICIITWYPLIESVTWGCSVQLSGFTPGSRHQYQVTNKKRKGKIHHFINIETIKTDNYHVGLYMLLSHWDIWRLMVIFCS